MNGGIQPGTTAVSERTLIFCDPPYRDSFTTYGTGFDDQEQERLCHWMNGLVKKGATVLFSNRRVGEDDTFFEDLLDDSFVFYDFPITYTAGRRKRTEDGFEAKKAVEFLAVSGGSYKKGSLSDLLS